MKTKKQEEFWGLVPSGSKILRHHTIRKKQALRQNRGPHMNIDGEVNITADREKDKRWGKGKCVREEQDREIFERIQQKTEMHEEKVYRAKYRSADWFMSLLGYQSIWMYIGSHLVVKCNEIAMTHQYITTIKAEVLVSPGKEQESILIRMGV